MSWRENIPEISVLPFIVNLLNTIGLALSNANSQKRILNEELSSIESELVNLRERSSSSFKTLANRKKLESIDIENKDDGEKESRIDEISRQLNERVEGGQELNYVSVRRAELIRRKIEIKTVEQPKVKILIFLSESRFNSSKQLLPRLQVIQTALDSVLSKLDNLIQSVSSIPIYGPVLASLLNTILSIVEQKLYLPLKTSLVLFEESLNALESVFFKN